MGGYCGKILNVNLNERETSVEEISERKFREYLGSRGIASRMLYDWVDEEVDPLSKDNVLIFSTGPLTGTLWPTSSRFTVTAKSPATDALGYANSAGHFGPEMKFAGYDVVVVRGKASSPVYLLINDDKAELRGAEEIWGRDTHDTERYISEKHGPAYKVASIGPAGENLVQFASIINDCYRAAGRTGMGSVMGSKNLKAIAVRGTGSIEIENPEEFYEFSVEAIRKAIDSPITESLREYGTPGLISPKQEIGDLPTRNHQTGQFDDFEKVSGESIKDGYFLRRRGCFACPICCSRMTEVREGSHSGTLTEGPEYETIDAFGPLVDNSDFGVIARANLACDRLGLDTISTGVLIAFIMEAFENGEISSEQANGLNLEWGEGEVILTLIDKIAHREGIGDLLADGVKAASEELGESTESYALQVKNVELPRQEPRVIKAFGLAHATGNRGADHLYALPTMGYGLRDAVKKYLPNFSDEEIDTIMDISSPENKGIQVSFEEKVCAIADSLGICKFSSAENYLFSVERIAKAYSLVTGLRLTEEQLLVSAERIINLERAYNAREGLDRGDDTLPKRFLEEPYGPSGSEPVTVELSDLLDEYYSSNDWDEKTGLPTPAKLSDLDLEDVLEDLRSKGILGK